MDCATHRFDLQYSLCLTDIRNVNDFQFNLKKKYRNFHDIIKDSDIDTS